MPDAFVQVGWAYRAVYALHARGPWLFAFRVPLPSDTAGNTYTVEVCPIYAPADVEGFMPPRPMPGHDTTWNHAKRSTVAQ